MKVIKFRDETWDFTFHVLVGVTAGQTKAYVDKTLDCDSIESDSFYGVTFTALNHAVIAFSGPFRKTPEGISVLAHEIFHAATQLLVLRDLSLNEETQEPFAYLMGSLMRRCLERL